MVPLLEHKLRREVLVYVCVDADGDAYVGMCVYVQLYMHNYSQIYTYLYFQWVYVCITHIYLTYIFAEIYS